MAGYKTYIIAIAIAAAGIAHQAGYINDSLYQTLLAILGPGGLITMRMAVAETEKKVATVAKQR